MENTLFMVQNNSIAEQVRKDAKIQEVEQEYLKKLIEVQEDADIQVGKVKSEYSGIIDELRASVSRLEEQLEEKDTIILSLKNEIQSLKEWSAANIDTFRKKLAEQEMQHQSELETWKMAELNRAVYEQAHHSNSVTVYGTNQNHPYQYQTPMLARNMQEYPSCSRFREQMTSYQKTPLVTHCKNTLPNTNTVHPLPTSLCYQNKTEFLSANEVYLQNRIVSSNNVEKNENGAEGGKENNKPIIEQKSKILVPNKKRKLFSNNQNLL